MMRSISAVAVVSILLQYVSLGEAFTAPKVMSRPSLRLQDSESPPDLQDTQQHLLMGFDEEFVHFPHRDFSALGVVTLCLDGLMQNARPYNNAGVETCWNFSSDRCRASQGGSLDTFISHASNPVFAAMINAQKWKVLSRGPIIPGTMTRGAMQTVLVDVTPSNGKSREFLWTMQKERRPPRQDCWLIHECIAKDNAYNLTL